MNRKEYEELLPRLTEKEKKKYFFYVKTSTLLARESGSETESNVRSKQKEAKQVASVRGLIERSGKVNPIDGTPVNEIPICVTPRSSFCLRAYEGSLHPTPEDNDVEWQGASRDDGTHRCGGLEGTYPTPGTYAYVSIYKHCQENSAVERRMESCISNDYDTEGLAHDELDTEKNIKAFVHERYYTEAHGIPHPPPNDDQKRDEYLEAACRIYSNKLEFNYRRFGKTRIRNWHLAGLKAASPGAYAKETSKQKIYENVLLNNPYGWSSSRPSVADGVKEVVVCSGLRRKPAIVTSPNGVRKDALPNAFGSKGNDVDLKIDLYAGLGNKTAVSDKEVHKFRLDVIREKNKANNNALLKEGKKLFDTLQFVRQMRTETGILADPKDANWVTEEHVLKVEKKWRAEVEKKKAEKEAKEESKKMLNKSKGLVNGAKLQRK